MSVQGSLVQRNDQAGVPQYRLPMILFMFAWPAAWFMFLIWVLSPLLFGTPATGEFISTWLFFGIATLGNAAELIVALVVLRREGYRLTIRDLRDRARLRLPKGLEVVGPGAGRPRHIRPQHSARAAERGAGEGAGLRPTPMVATDFQPDGGSHLS